MRFSEIKWYSFLLVTKTHGNSLVIYRNTTLRDNTDIITNRQLIHGKISLIFCEGIFKSDTINVNFSDLWLKWTQTMKMKQNQTFFHGTYSNLTAYTFLLKNTKVFQWLSTSKFLSFVTERNPNNSNETKSDIFSWDIFKSDIVFHSSQNTKIFQWLS